MNIISACTRNCYDGCSLITRVRNGVIVGIDGNKSHLITQGSICPRLKLFIKNVLSEKRLRTPLRKTGKRGTGSFEIISWDTALHEITDRIKETMRKYSSSAVALYDTGGNNGLLSRNFPLRFINAINGSVADDTIYSAAGDAALDYTFGSSYGYPAEHIPNAKLIVLWGVNSKWTNMHGAMLVQKAKKKGASIWIIDPIRTATAEMGRHLQIKPGADAALALTMINHLIENRMHDEEFISKYMLGFENLVEIARKYDVHRSSEITGLDANDIVELATEFITLRPCVIHVGMGLQRQRNGGEMVRAISLIPSIVGQHRGFIYSNDANDFDMDYLTATHLRTLPENRFNPLELPRLLKEKRIRLLIVINSNPLVTLPNQNAIRNALRESDVFIVTHDLFMTDTADYSDIVIPATSLFEHFDIVLSNFHDYLNLNEPAISRVGESKSNVDFFKALARTFGLGNKELFEKEESIVAYLLKNSKRVEADFISLRRRGFAKMAPLPLDNYQTPSGMIEIYSERAFKDGLSAVPDHVPVRGTEPYQLLSPCTLEMNHSSYHHLTPNISPKVLINPDDAAILGINDGRKITLENQQGSIILPAEITDRVPQGVVVSHTGFWPKLSNGNNINFLTSDYIQRYRGSSAYQSTFVRIIP